ncbi:MAG TPA: HEPN domain-containing protein [Anaerolineae bacterium]
MNETVRQWVAKAEGDYASASRELAGGEKCNFNLVLFLCQQCVEKLTKGLLMARCTVAPKTHDLAELSRLISSLEQDWQWNDAELKRK